MTNVIKAIQEIYPGINRGFVYWETKKDGTAWEDPIDGLIWENKQYQKPTWEQIQSRINDVDLTELKTSKINQVKTNKKAALYSPVEYNGRTYINSEIAGNNLRAAYDYKDEPIDWLDIEGNKVVLTKVDIKAIINLIMDKRASVYFKEASLLNSINSANSLEELEAINIEF
jgi:hypothetical protein